MSIADDWNAAQLSGVGMWHIVTTDQKPLHRVAEVRRQQGVSLRSICRKMGLSAEEVRRQEHPSCDLTLTQLSAWQHALDVPLQDLLIDLDAPLSAPVMSRAKLLRAMKTVRAIQETSHEVGIRRMATMLAEQMTEAMPELREVTAWHSVGQRRTQDECGKIAEQPVSDNFASDGMR